MNVEQMVREHLEKLSKMQRKAPVPAAFKRALKEMKH